MTPRRTPCKDRRLETNAAPPDSADVADRIHPKRR